VPSANKPRGNSSGSGREGTPLRITRSALDLFEELGYLGTTIDAIAERAGVARRTFFHHFRSKDDVVFAHHHDLTKKVVDYLGQPTELSAVSRVHGAVELIFSSYVSDPELSRRRYRLVRQNAELRNREIAWVSGYQRLFAGFLRDRLGEEPRGVMFAESFAAASVSTHNMILREWLRSTDPPYDPMQRLDDGLRWLASAFPLQTQAPRTPRVLVALLDGEPDARTVSDALSALRFP